VFAVLWLAYMYALAGCVPVGEKPKPEPLPAGTIAFSEQNALWLMRADGTGKRQLVSSIDEDLVEPSFSPDGQRIAFATGQQLEGPIGSGYRVDVMNLDGTGRRTISPSSGGASPAWSPDGSRIAFSSRGRLMTVRADGSGLTNLLLLGDQPVWSPDSRLIAFSAQGLGGATTSAVYVANANGSGLRKMSPDAKDAFPGAWSTDATELLYTAGDSVERDLYSVRIKDGKVRRLLHRRGTHFGLAWLSDGRIIYSDSQEDQPKTAWRVMHVDGTGDRAFGFKLFDPIAWLPDAPERSRLRAAAAKIKPITLADQSDRRLVDVGRHRLFIDCMGSGSSVILDAGLGVESSTWLAVQRDLSAHARVCRYDRAGLGLSDPGPMPRDSAVMVGELHRLLGLAGIPPPYVMVGASFGGLNVQLYERTFPDEVRGLVLVDSLHPTFDKRIEALLTQQLITQRRHDLEMNDEGVKFADILRSESQLQARFQHIDKPLVVLRHGLPFDGPFGWPTAQVEALWLTLQQELAARSSQGSLVLAAKSHHRIAESEPDLVVAAVRKLLAG
jgi:pimeloyl-ACP methyl ester carboxylesterase